LLPMNQFACEADLSEGTYIAVMAAAKSYSQRRSALEAIHGKPVRAVFVSEGERDELSVIAALAAVEKRNEPIRVSGFTTEVKTPAPTDTFAVDQIGKQNAAAPGDSLVCFAPESYERYGPPARLQGRRLVRRSRAPVV
jgi:hypothetical protein